MLPVDACLPELLAALQHGPAAVLAAPPGAGKTTRVPLALKDAPWARGGRILVLAPRRLAARAAAARMAASLGERVGETVGHHVRLDRKASGATRIEVVTEGVFTRRILADPSLEGVAAVVLDEFHERSLEGDLALALARDAQQGLREDLRLLVMSATLDDRRVSDLLGDAPIIRSEGRMFPVAMRYVGRDPHAPIEDQVAAAVLRALSAEPGGVLAFLPGAAEIARCARRIEERGPPTDVDLHLLFGAMEPSAQDAAIAPPRAGRRKVVLATSIAETSLTIEGVRVVIDSGLARRPRHDSSVGLTRLETVRVSQAAANQRAGRAGRVEPGACWRLWDEPETRALAPFDRPEILEAELSSFALDLAAWGVRDPASLAFLDPPLPAAWREARALLSDLGALDADGRLTPHGAALSDFGLPPRLAHMVLAAAAAGRGLLAARIAALLTEQGLGGRDVDLGERLARFEAETSARAQAARRLAQTWADQAGGGGGSATPSPDAIGLTLAAAYPARVAKARHGKSGEFVMANGRAAALGAEEPLARVGFLVVAEAAGQAERARIQLAAPLSAAAVETHFADRIDTVDRVEIDEASGRFLARRQRMLGRIVLSEAPLERPAGTALWTAVEEHLRRVGADALPWSDAARRFQARVRFLRRLEPDADWPDLSAEALLREAGAWLPGRLDGLRGLADLDLAAALADRLTYQQRARLDQEAPARFRSPAEGTTEIDYVDENGPAIDVRLQELFGLAVHPSVASGRAPLLLRLLSPAQRPIQTTRDLPGFWRGSYAAVRAEMRGRYPKHPWPEDPMAAAPTRRAKPRP